MFQYTFKSKGSNIAQAILHMEDQHANHHAAIKAYANLLVQYSMDDEDFDTTEIFKLLAKKLADLTFEDFSVYEDCLLKIFCALDKHPRIGKLLLKYFAKNRNLFRNNTFYLVCHIMLCSIPRFQCEAVVQFSISLTKLWNFYEPIDKVGWLKTMVRSSVIKSIRERMILILEVLKKRSNVLFPCFAPGLQKIALELIQSESRKSLNVRLNEGRLMETSGQIGFLGRRIFVEVATLNVCGLDRQLSMLINAVFASSNSSSIAYVLIDVLLELTVRTPVLLLNNWKVFEKLIESVCSLSNVEISTALIRSIMPVINQRQQLRSLLLKTMKGHMLNPSKMPYALPIILLLLKSLSDNPTVKQVTQLSQSFATFSTQVLNEIGLCRQSEQSVALEVFGCIKRCVNQSILTKCLIYKGLVDICKRNSCFVIQIIDLLVDESIPELMISNYVEARRDGSDSPLKIPLAHITMALSNLIRISISDREAITSTANMSDTMTVKAETVLQNIVDMVLRNDLSMLSLDAMTDFGTSLQGSMNCTFARLMISVYDVLIQHLWIVEMMGNVNEETEKDVVVTKILNIVQKRYKLVANMDSRKSKNVVDENGERAAATNAVSLSEKKKTLSRSSVVDLNMNLQDLDKIITALIDKNVDEGNDQYKEMRKELIGWTIERIHFSVEKLDPFSTTSVIPMSCFASLAKALIMFYIGDDVAEDLSVFRYWDPLKTYAIISYKNIIKYLTKRYQHRSQPVLMDLLTLLEMNFAERDLQNVSSTSAVSAAGIQSSGVFAAPTQTQFAFRRSALTQSTTTSITEKNNAQSAEVSRADAVAFNRAIYKHLIVYSNQSLTALFSIFESFQRQKMGADFQRQALVMFELCNHFASMLPASNTALQRNCLKLFHKLAKVNKIEDRMVSKELWRIIFELVAHSDYSEIYINFFNSLINELLMITTGNSVEGDESGYSSITAQNCEEIMNSVMETICKILSNISLVFEIKTEMGGDIDDEFLVMACATTKRLIDVTKLAMSVVVERENLTTPFMILMTQVYEIVFVISKQLEDHKEAKIDEWNSVNELAEMVQGSLRDLLVLYSDSQLGASHENENDTNVDSSFTKRVRKSKKDEKVYVGHERAFEKLQVQLIVLSKLFGDDRLILKTIKLNTVRDFSIDSELLTRRLERRRAENGGEANSNVEEQENENEINRNEENDITSSNVSQFGGGDVGISSNQSEDNENIGDDGDNESENISSIPASGDRVPLSDASYRENQRSGGFCDQDESFDTFCNQKKKRKVMS